MTNGNIDSAVEAKSRSELFQEVGEICAAVTAIVSPKELLESSLQKTIDLFGASRGSIFVLNDKTKNLVLKSAFGMEFSEQKQMVKRLGQGIVGQVAQIKKPVVVGDITQDARFRDYKARGSYTTASFICAPLLLKDKLIGVINISDKHNGGKFTNDELQILDFLASQIALNYRRIELYQKFKKAVRESKSLKNQLGRTNQETKVLQNKIVVQEKLATIGKLAGGIAHEFNNPLDGVLRYTNLCLEHVKDDEVVRGYLLEVKQGLNRMANIVKSLLACARSTSPSMAKIDPSAAVEQALGAVQSHIFHKNITVEKDLAKGIPLIIDFGLERAVSNLLRNAIDAVAQGGYVRIRTGLEGSRVVIEVADNGAGIDQDELEKIFEPFYTTKDIDKGCGLGLTIVSEVVKSYGGEIKVQSALKKGTAFLLSIPVKTV